MRTTDNSQAILTPEQVEALWVVPTLARAAATADLLTTMVVRLDANVWRAPRVTTDPSAAWVDEGQEIPVSDAEFAEVEVSPSAIKALTVVSSEVVEDTDGEAANIIGDGLVRDTARKLDAAFVGNLAAPAAAGLESIAYTVFEAGPLDSLDPFAAAVAAAEDEYDALVTSFLCSSGTALRLGRLRVEEGSNLPLLSVDPTLPTRRMIEGRPLITCPGIPDDVVWALPADRIRTLVRTEADVVADGSAYFSSDRIAIRGRMRVGFGFLQEEAITRMAFDPAAA